MRSFAYQEASEGFEGGDRHFSLLDGGLDGGGGLDGLLRWSLGVLSLRALGQRVDRGGGGALRRKEAGSGEAGQRGGPLRESGARPRVVARVDAAAEGVHDADLQEGRGRDTHVGREEAKRDRSIKSRGSVLLN